MVRASVVAIGLVAVMAAPPLVRADDSPALNGRYLAQSNGEWAKTNQRFHDEATVRSIWTITSTCSDPTDCAGRVTSDQGWSADIYTTNGTWYVKHVIDNWEPCYDGSTAVGLQIFVFTPVDANALIDPTSTTLVGEDKTTSPSGSCGRNQSLVIRMPFKLRKIA